MRGGHGMEPMKTPMSVRVIAALFGLVAMAMAIGWTSLFIKDVSQRSYNVQIPFVAAGLIVVGTAAWMCLGLVRGSRDARAIALALCWLGFIGTPVSMLASLSDKPAKVFGVGLAGLAVFFSIYRVLTSTTLRNGFFRCP